MPLVPRFTAIGSAVLFALSSTSIAASPWFSAGDPRLRHSLQQLADRGYLNRTMTTWPVMVESVSNGLDRDQAMADAHAGAALSALSAAQPQAGRSMELSLQVVDEQAFLRNFAGGARDSGVGFAVEHQGESLSGRLEYTRAFDPEDTKENRLDGSYLAAQLANVSLGAGYIDRWWGPGWQSSLVLSSNARPIPAVWLSRVDERPSSLPVLKYLGPWQFVMFGGQLESERAVPDARMFGMRLTLRPVPGLDIGFSRSATLGGDGQLESWEVLWRAVAGRSNGTLNGRPIADQMGSIDLRYGFSVGEQTVGVYTQLMGEDEADLFPTKRSWLHGIDATSSWGGAQQQWFLEYSNTLARDWLQPTPVPGVTYENVDWRTGNRYLGRNQASTFEGDSHSLTAGVYHFLSGGRDLGLAISHVKLDVAGAGVQAEITDPDITYFIPAEKRDVWFVNASYSQPLAGGELKAWLQLLDEPFMRATGGEQERVSAGVSYQYRW